LFVTILYRRDQRHNGDGTVHVTCTLSCPSHAPRTWKLTPSGGRAIGGQKMRTARMNWHRITDGTLAGRGPRDFGPLLKSALSQARFLSTLPLWLHFAPPRFLIPRTARSKGRLDPVPVCLPVGQIIGPFPLPVFGPTEIQQYDDSLDSGLTPSPRPGRL